MLTFLDSFHYYLFELSKWSKEETQRACKLHCCVRQKKRIYIIPMAPAESERCFSALKRIKSFLRSTMKQDRLNALAVLSVEQEFIQKLLDFNDMVINLFAFQRGCLCKLLFHWGKLNPTELFLSQFLFFNLTSFIGMTVKSKYCQSH